MSPPRLSLPCLLSLSLVACAGEGPTEPAVSYAAADVRRETEVARPAGGNCVTVTQALPPFPPPTLTLDITGVCRLRHLGRTTMHALQVVDLTTGAFTNTTTYTAANGDQLFTAFSGQVISSDAAGVVFIGTETVVGGTGRFEGATGESSAEGSATQPNALGAGTGEYSTEGAITY